jgi:hypothetical protein
MGSVTTADALEVWHGREEEKDGKVVRHVLLTLTIATGGVWLRQ